MQVHGDAAFSGQGVIAETLALSQAPHFSVNGSIHLVTNNQIGYTAEAHIGRFAEVVWFVRRHVETFQLVTTCH